MKTGYLVCDAMTQRPISVEHDLAIVECAKVMADNHVGTLIVKKNNRLAGLLSEKDIVRKVIAEGLDPAKILAGEMMETKFAKVSPEQDIYDAIKIMRDNNVRHVPVMDGKKMVGFLTGKDILKIQPQLFEVLADKIELREWERKVSAIKED